ncbi:biopolymer transporter ExbD [Spongiibacter sp. KMU-158]|uniref:Biopolymer transporter ExbD n=1 Tax=Spongiibacter pelagi TaxID=2760804 RepID=A0A927C2D6_9GAMM|nr:biopolymer transporter ExbD [Spongiibacter pelagi]MBD2860024.1 biopolymer transporter ExbD [Spongiibacter pelagi]
MNSALISRRKARSIGLTALIDVVFILLMFFMLTSSFSRWQAHTLQSQIGGETVSDSSAPLFLLMFKAGHFALFRDGEQGALGELNEVVSDLNSSELDARTLVLVPDSEMSVQSIMNALGELDALGISAVSLGQSAAH